LAQARSHGGRRHAGFSQDEQRIVEHLAQPGQRVADGGRGNVQFTAGAGHTAMAHDRFEDAKEIKVDPSNRQYQLLVSLSAAQA
jgi:hypothetical protein